MTSWRQRRSWSTHSILDDNAKSKVIGSDEDPAQAQQALSTDNTIVFFEDGEYVGDLTITGEDVILFGQGIDEPSVGTTTTVS